MRPNTADCTCFDPKTRKHSKARLFGVAYHTLIYHCQNCDRTFDVDVSPEEADELIRRASANSL